MSIAKRTFALICFAFLLGAACVNGAPAANTETTEQELAKVKEGEIAENPMCAQAFYNHTLFTNENGTDVETAFIQNGCCIYQDGVVTDTLTNATRTATEAERQAVRDFLAEGQRQACEFEAGLNRRLQNFLAYFFDVFRQPRGPLPTTSSNGTTSTAAAWDIPELPCFCADEHCFKRISHVTKTEETTTSKKEEEQQEQQKHDNGEDKKTGEEKKSSSVVGGEQPPQAAAAGDDQQQTVLEEEKEVDGGN